MLLLLIPVHYVLFTLMQISSLVVFRSLFSITTSLFFFLFIPPKSDPHPLLLIIMHQNIPNPLALYQAVHWDQLKVFQVYHRVSLLDPGYYNKQLEFLLHHLLEFLLASLLAISMAYKSLGLSLLHSHFTEVSSLALHLLNIYSYLQFLFPILRFIIFQESQHIQKEYQVLKVLTFLVSLLLILVSAYLLKVLYHPIYSLRQVLLVQVQVFLRTLMLFHQQVFIRTFQHVLYLELEFLQKILFLVFKNPALMDARYLRVSCPILSVCLHLKMMFNQHLLYPMLIQSLHLLRLVMLQLRVLVYSMLTKPMILF